MGAEMRFAEEGRVARERTRIEEMEEGIQDPSH